MSDPVTEYQDAFMRLEAADKEVLAFRSLLNNSIEALKHPTKIIIIDGVPMSARDGTRYDQRMASR
jgi:hypothetical protein